MSKLESCIDLLLTRRSIRRFKPDPVPDEVIRKVLDIARYAPSAANRQPWDVVVIKDRSKIEELSKLHRGAAPLANAPVALVITCDKNISPISYQVDCAAFTTYLLLAAHALGLGTVWIQALRNPEEIKKIIKAPEGKEPVAIVAMGWPAESPTPKPRRSVNEFLHSESF